MEEQDRKEMRQIVKDVVALHSGASKGRFELIKTELGFIKTQTTETNGRVLKAEADIRLLEKQNLVHVVSCPNTAKIVDLEKTEFGRKAVLKFGAKAGLIAGAIIGALLPSLN